MTESGPSAATPLFGPRLLGLFFAASAALILASVAPWHLGQVNRNVPLGAITVFLLAAGLIIGGWSTARLILDFGFDRMVHACLGQTALLLGGAMLLVGIEFLIQGYASGFIRRLLGSTVAAPACVVFGTLLMLGGIASNRLLSRGQ